MSATFSQNIAAWMTHLAETQPELFFGGKKILVSKLHAAAAPNMPLTIFKEKLLAANRTRELTMTRCDMVRCFPAADIATSETRDGFGSEFHFVVLQ